MQSAAGGRCNGWIALRPGWVRGMERCAYERAEAEFEGVWGANSTG